MAQQQVRICSIDDCDNTHKAKGYCEKHYMRVRIHGDPNSRKSLRERFEEKVELIPFSTCHWWNSTLSPSGYGQITVNYKSARAHRVAYEMYIGPIPKGMIIMHKCDNPACVNPDHLKTGTQQDNMDDMNSKGRRCSGENHPNSKLTKADALEIRRLGKTHGQRELAKRFDINSSIVNDIINLKAWNHI